MKKETVQQRILRKLQKKQFSQNNFSIPLFKIGFHLQPLQT